MNNRTRLLIAAVPVLCVGVCFAASRHARQLEALKTVRVNTPVVGDTAQGQARFKPELLLKGNSLMKSAGARTTLTTADTAGYFKLTRPQNGQAIETLFTSIRPSRYIKGSLKVTSNAIFEVMSGLESKGVKSTVEDSITGASTLAVPFEIQPEETAEITVKLLSQADMKSEPVIKIEFEPEKKFEDVDFTLEPMKQRRFLIHQMSDGPRAYRTSLSPDGNYLITNFREVYDAENTRYWSTLTDVRTGKEINSSLNGNAAWMPKGARLYYTEKRHDDYDLIVQNVPSMSSTTLATGLPSASVTFAPDESYFIYYDNVEGKHEKLKGIMTRYTAPDDRMPNDRDRAYLMKYDLATSTVQPLTYGGTSTFLSDISPDSRHILYLTVKQTPSKYPFYENTMIQMDVNTLKTDTIYGAEGEANSAIYSPAGKQLFITGGPGSFGGIGANAGSEPIPNAFDMQGFILDLATRQVRAMTKDFDPSIDGTPVWNKADGQIYFRAKEGFFTPIFSLNPKTGKITRLNTIIDNCANFSIGENESQWLSYTGQAYEYVGRACLMNLKTGKSKVVYDPYSKELAKINFGKTEPWTFTAKDGTFVDGTMCLPPDFDPTKKYPLIVYYYGGTTPSERRMDHAYVPQLFASRDYVVYVVNPSGTIGYGQEFSARHVNAWGKRTADEIIQGVKEFCRTHPYVDDKKIGCLGASYGGFMTMYLQTLTDIFAAAVSHAGISNVTSYWGEGYWGYSYNSVAAAQSYPWNNPKLFTEQGALFNADKIHTPLLLLHGTADTNVPIGESIQLFNALKVLGRDVEFITVEGANHVITEYDKREIWHATIMAWFAKWLQDDSRWWDSMYGDK